MTTIKLNKSYKAREIYGIDKSRHAVIIVLFSNLYLTDYSPIHVKFNVTSKEIIKELKMV